MLARGGGQGQQLAPAVGHPAAVVVVQRVAAGQPQALGLLAQGVVRAAQGAVQALRAAPVAYRIEGSY